jgi:hypothetical protein
MMRIKHYILHPKIQQYYNIKKNGVYNSFFFFYLNLSAVDSARIVCGFDVAADVIPISIRLQPFPPFVAFQALGGVDDAAELCCAADSCRCQLPSETPECRFLSDAKPPTTTTNTSSSNEPKFNTSVP